MERLGYALSLTKITDDGWRATFHSHPQLSADGFATDAKPWRAVRYSLRRGTRSGRHTARNTNPQARMTPLVSDSSPQLLFPASTQLLRLPIDIPMKKL